MNDLISRQAVLKICRRYWHPTYNPIMEEVEKLPSAQPEPCKDTVSRQKLLSDLEELVAAWKKYPVMAEQIKGVETAIGYVGAIPPAQQEQKKGHWILSDDREWKTCSNCGAEVDVSMGTGVYVGVDAVDELCFCPNCGCRMEGDEHE